MTQQVAWPVTVDMGLIRKRVHAIMSKLSTEFPETERYLNSVCYRDEVPSEEVQDRIRARVFELVESDGHLEEFPDFQNRTSAGILTQYLLDEIFGFGPLGPVLRDPTVCDILVDGPDSVYVLRDGGYEKAAVFFENTEHLLLTMSKILRPLGCELTEETPTVQTLLPNGSWVVAALPPKSTPQHNPTFFIRAARK